LRSFLSLIDSMKRTARAKRDIIVIGGSAGAIEGVAQILRSLPANLPAAIFVVIHVSPSGPSLLPEVLSRAGSLRAVHAVDNAPIEAGGVYVAPPDHHLLLELKRMRLSHGSR